jgi:hypothetical protein
MPRKIDSRKNENPSMAKPSPKTLPNVAVKVGHRTPLSKLNTAPVITPIANRVIITRLHRARDRPTQRVAGALPPPLHEQHYQREGDAEAHQRDVNGERQRLHLPRPEQVILRDRTQRRRAVA